MCCWAVLVTLVQSKWRAMCQPPVLVLHSLCPLLSRTAWCMAAHVAVLRCLVDVLFSHRTIVKHASPTASAQRGAALCSISSGVLVWMRQGVTVSPAGRGQQRHGCTATLVVEYTRAPHAEAYFSVTHVRNSMLPSRALSARLRQLHTQDEVVVPIPARTKIEPEQLSPTPLQIRSAPAGKCAGACTLRKLSKRSGAQAGFT